MNFFTGEHITVVIPAYNAAAFIERALDGVLQQTVRPHQVLIIDDASQDDTCLHVRKWIEAHEELPVTIYNLDSNQGQAAALNYGFLRATSPLIATLDADDQWLPQKTQWQLDEMRSGAHDCVFGWAQQVDQREGTPGRHPTPLLARLPSAQLMRREIFLQLGGYEQSLRIGAVVDWASRLQTGGFRIGVVDRVVYRRYIHGRNLGLREGNAHKYLELVRQHLHRRTPSP